LISLKIVKNIVSVLYHFSLKMMFIQLFLYLELYVYKSILKLILIVLFRMFNRFFPAFKSYYLFYEEASDQR